MKPTLADLTQLVEAAEVAAPALSSDSWAAAAALADDPDLSLTADGAYLLGYALYQHESSSPGAAERAKQFLYAALTIEPKHIYARLYLGHVAFDKRDYAEALQQFAEIEPHAFTMRRQAWRDLKLQELRICCLLELRQTQDLIAQFEKLLALAGSMESTDAPVVHELPVLLQSRFGPGAHAA